MKDLSELVSDVRADAKATLAATGGVIVAALYEISPAWGGTFRENWRANEQPNGSVTVDNTTSYATIAMDLQPGVFKAKGGPIKEPVVTGRRVGRFRGQVENDGEGGSRSTADLFWFEDYMNGGPFVRDFRRTAGEVFGVDVNL